MKRERSQYGFSCFAITKGNLNLFIARWHFAPASELSLGYRVGKTAFANNVNGDYLDGIHTLSYATD